MLEKQKEEIQKKFGIDENILKSININDYQMKYSNYPIKKINKAKKEIYQNLTKIEVQKEPEIIKNINYKTPEKLVDSLKYEPNINDLIDEKEFKPIFKNIKESKSKSINPPTYDISNYVDDVINQNFFDDIFH